MNVNKALAAFSWDSALVKMSLQKLFSCHLIVILTAFSVAESGK